jgi:hypothetical protein
MGKDLMNGEERPPGYNTRLFGRSVEFSLMPKVQAFRRDLARIIYCNLMPGLLVLRLIK